MPSQCADDSSIPAADRTACPKCGRVVVTGGGRAFAPVACPHCEAAMTAPGTLGEFLLLRPLGEGALWTTYKAFDRSLGREVAIKVLSRAAAAEADQVGAFLAGGRAMASMKHPQIVRVYSLGEQDGRQYIVMEFVPAGAMTRLIRAGRGMDEPGALALVRSAAVALQAAARENIHHGDVKPSNILLDEQGQAKLADFALWRPGDMESVSALGGRSLHYAAPERLVGRPAFVRSDIYSLGAVLFHALTGARLAPPTPVSTLGQNAWSFADPATAASILALRPALHPQTAELVAGMLRTEPTERPQSYEALLAELEATRRAVKAGVPLARRVTDLDLVKEALRATPPPSAAAARHAKSATPPPAATPRPAPRAEATRKPRAKVDPATPATAAAEATPAADSGPATRALSSGSNPRRLLALIALLLMGGAAVLGASIWLTAYFARAERTATPPQAKAPAPPTAAPAPPARPPVPHSLFAANGDYPAVAQDVLIAPPVVYCVCADTGDVNVRGAVHWMLLASMRSLQTGQFGIVLGGAKNPVTMGHGLIAADDAGLAKARAFLARHASSRGSVPDAMEAAKRLGGKTVVLVTGKLTGRWTRPVAQDLKKRQIRLVVLGLTKTGRNRKSLAAFAQQASGQCKMFDPQALGQTWARRHGNLPPP